MLVSCGSSVVEKFPANGGRIPTDKRGRCRYVDVHWTITRRRFSHEYVGAGISHLYRASKLTPWGSMLTLVVPQSNRCSDAAAANPETDHPMAWCRIVGPTDGSTATDAATRKPWQQIPEYLPNFPGRTREIDGQSYVSFGDYAKWKSRHAKGNLKSGVHDGIVVSDWNQWVDAEGREGAAILAGVTVGKLSGYSDNYRYHVCRDAEELADETSRRESLLDSLRPGWPDSLEKERYLKRVG